MFKKSSELEKCTFLIDLRERDQQHLSVRGDGGRILESYE